ncbi:MAG TPA: response regulator [Luteibaculaceae bacterium]|nr:response regulator [Luteibaculaceae bacterium]
MTLYTAISDDDRMCLRAMQNALLEVGLSSIIVSQSASEFKATLTKDAAVIVIDLMMPENQGEIPKMVGDHLFHYAKTINSEAKIIIVSAIEDYPLIVNLFNDGLFAFVSKSAPDWVNHVVYKVKEGWEKYNKNLHYISDRRAIHALASATQRMLSRLDGSDIPA